MGEYSDFYGLPAVCGLDLAVGAYDLASMVVIVKVDDNEYKALSYTFSAKDSLADNEDRLKVPLQALAQDPRNHFYTTSGKTFCWNEMSTRIADILSNFNVVKMGVDPYKYEELNKHLEDKGFNVEVEKMKQTFPFFDAYIGSLENLIYDKKVTHNNNYFLGYCMSNAVLIEDAQGNRKIVKRSANQKIDNAVAFAQAAYLVETDLSVYDDNTVSYAFI